MLYIQMNFNLRVNGGPASNLQLKGRASSYSRGRASQINIISLALIGRSDSGGKPRKSANGLRFTCNRIRKRNPGKKRV